MGKHPPCELFVEQLVNICAPPTQTGYFEDLESSSDYKTQVAWSRSGVGLLDFGDTSNQTPPWLHHPTRASGFIVLCGICQSSRPANQVLLAHYGPGSFDRDWG